MNVPSASPPAHRASPSPPSSLVVEPALSPRREPSAFLDTYETSPILGRRRQSVTRFFQTMRAPSVPAASTPPPKPILWSNDPSLNVTKAKETKLIKRLQNALHFPGEERLERRSVSFAQAPSLHAKRPEPKRSLSEARMSEVMREVRSLNDVDGTSAGRNKDIPLEEHWLGRRMGERGRRILRRTGLLIAKLLPAPKLTLEQQAVDSVAARIRLRNQATERDRGALLKDASFGRR